jgi:hypothetical protein
MAAVGDERRIVTALFADVATRLLDILRHPDEAIDRSDLLLAQG